MSRDGQPVIPDAATGTYLDRLAALCLLRAPHVDLGVRIAEGGRAVNARRIIEFEGAEDEFSGLRKSVALLSRCLEGSRP